MNSFKKRCVVLFAVLVLGTAALPSLAVEVKKAPETPSNEMVEKGWEQRCTEQKPDKKQCEIFQRIDMKSSQMRVAEFAIGFPHEKDLEKGAARGVVILPLGILLEAGFGMKVDDDKPLVFKPRFCTPSGCVSFVNLSKDILGSMKKAKTVTFLFKTAEGQNVNLVMNLSGFEKALKELQ